MNKADVENEFDKYLRRYQKMSLFLIYPALVSFFGLCLSLITNGFTYSLCFASNYILAYHLSLNPIGEGVTISNIIILGVGVITLGLFVYLGLMAAKAKRHFMIAGVILYFADFVYAIILGFDGIYGKMELVNYIISLAMHVAFLGIYSYMIVLYVKLLRVNVERMSK